MQESPLLFSGRMKQGKLQWLLIALRLFSLCLAGLDNGEIGVLGCMSGPVFMDIVLDRFVPL
ncbi:hypothetical protein WJ59_03130 [Burkholderia gladioli]|nr:hypothetical protein WJ59_03130 [Burkholderia gladioli]